MAERTFDDFDEFANEYRNIHTKNLQWSGADSLYFASQKVQMMHPYECNTTLKMLDVGCGDGATELFVHQHFPDWIITAVDVSGTSIQVAQKRNIANVTFLLYDGTTIPATDNSVDIVFMAGVLHHVNFNLHPNLLKEIYRVLKIGGRLYLFEHNPLNPMTRYLVNTCVFDKDAKLLSNIYSRSLVRKFKMKILNNTFIIFFPRKGLLSKLIFLEKWFSWFPFGGQYFIRAIK